MFRKIFDRIFRKPRVGGITRVREDGYEMRSGEFHELFPYCKEDPFEW